MLTILAPVDFIEESDLQLSSRSSSYSPLQSFSNIDSSTDSEALIPNTSYAYVPLSKVNLPAPCEQYFVLFTASLG